jgi:hypothetical protein
MPGSVWVTCSLAASASAELKQEFAGWGADVGVPASSAFIDCSGAWLMRRVDHEFAVPPQAAAVTFIAQVIDADEYFATPAGKELAELGARDGFAVARRPLITVFDTTQEVGDFWGIVRLRFMTDRPGSEAAEAEFNRWYGYDHLPGACARPGIYRGWRVWRDDSAYPKEPTAQVHWAVYELSAPDALGSVDKVGQWNGSSGDYIQDRHRGRSYHELLARYTSS